MNIKKKYASTFVAVAVTIVLAALYSMQQKTEPPSNNENISKAVGMRLWSVEDVNDFSYNTNIVKTQYGTIVEADPPANENNVETMFVYLPDTPFPTNQVQDRAVLIFKDSANEHNRITNSFMFILTPEGDNLQVIIAKE